MSREPLFMKDLHKRQSEEYERTKKLNLRQFIEYINNRAKKLYITKNIESKTREHMVCEKNVRYK